jgi:hypothetical protein
VRAGHVADDVSHRGDRNPNASAIGEIPNEKAQPILFTSATGS